MLQRVTIIHFPLYYSACCDSLLVYASIVLHVVCTVCLCCCYRRYFGEKVGIYFTWIGFYTTWLLPVSLLGIVIFLYGLSTIPASRNAVA